MRWKGGYFIVVPSSAGGKRERRDLVHALNFLCQRSRKRCKGENIRNLYLAIRVVCVFMVERMWRGVAPVGFYWRERHRYQSHDPPIAIPVWISRSVGVIATKEAAWSFENCNSISIFVSLLNERSPLVPKVNTPVYVWIKLTLNNKVNQVRSYLILWWKLVLYEFKRPSLVQRLLRSVSIIQYKTIPKQQLKVFISGHNRLNPFA